MAQSSENKLSKRFDQDIEITGTLTGVDAEFSNKVEAKYITLSNQELTLNPPAYSIWMDANDSNRPANLGDYAGSSPLGLYVNGDDGIASTTLGSGTVQLYHTGHFSGTHISNWQTAYNYSQTGHLPLTGGTISNKLTISDGGAHIKKDSGSQETVLTIEQLADVGSSQDLLIKTANDRDVGIKLETAGGSHYIWQDSNGDDALIISAAGNDRTNDATIIFSQGHDVTIPQGSLTIKDEVNPSIYLQDTTNDVVLRMYAANNYIYFTADEGNTAASTRMSFRVDGEEVVFYNSNQDAFFANNVNATTFIGDLDGNADTVDNKHATDFTLDYVTTNNAYTENSITVGPSAVSGGRFISPTYNGASRLGILSSMYGSGNLLIGYGLEGNSGASGYVSTYENFSGRHGGLEIYSKGFKYVGDTTNSQTTIGDSITVTEFFNLNEGDLSISGDMTFEDGKGIVSNSGAEIKTGGGGNTFQAQAGASNASAFIANNSAGTTKFSVDEGGDGYSYFSGKLAVGQTTEPSYQLKVNGTSYLEGDTTIVGTLALNEQDSLSFEGGKHWITYNDGAGNFNIRVGHYDNSSGVEECTEAGYIFHDEWSQSGGWRQFNVSADSMAVGETIGTDSSWRTQIEYNTDQAILRYRGSTRLGTTSDGVNITGDINADSFIKDSGTQAQFLKADGTTTELSINTGSGLGGGQLLYDAATGVFDFNPADLTGLATTTQLNNYLLKTGGTLTGLLTTDEVNFLGGTTFNAMATFNVGPTINGVSNALYFSRDASERNLIIFQNQGVEEWDLWHRDNGTLEWVSDANGLFKISSDLTATGDLSVGGTVTSGLDLGNDIDMNDNDVLDVRHIRFVNQEGENIGNTSGALMFDENFYSDTEYGSTSIWNGNGGGLAIYNEDGWGRIISDANMEFLNAEFNSLNTSTITTSTINGDVAFTGEIQANGAGVALHFDDQGVEGMSYNPTEFGAEHTGRYFLRFDYTNNASYPYLTNRTPNGAVVIKTGVAAGGGENEHFRIEGGDGTVDAYFTDVNLGIGTTLPRQKLSVVGTINSDSGNDYYGAWLSGDSSSSGQSHLGLGAWWSTAAYVRYYNNDRLSIYTYDANEDVTLQEAGGKVGIGTSAPRAQFDVYNSGGVKTRYGLYGSLGQRYSSWDTWVGTNTSPATDSTSSIELLTDYTASGASALKIGFQDFGFYQWTPTELSGLSAGSDLSLSNPSIFINSARRVGIGTSGPDYKLTVSDSSGTYGINGDSSGNIYHYSASGEHRFRANGGTTNALTINNNLISINKEAYFGSDVGINRTSPNATLHVVGDMQLGSDTTTQKGDFHIYNGTGKGEFYVHATDSPYNTSEGVNESPSMRLHLDNGAGSGFEICMDDDDVDRASGNNGFAFRILTQDGGFGTYSKSDAVFNVSPQGHTYIGYKATRSGLTGDPMLAVNGIIHASSDVVAYGASDKRLKDNIEPIKNPIDKINKIGGYEFDWNNNQDAYEGHDVGVIAQEIEEVLPEIVTTRENGYKAVKYEKIVPLLIEAIKEQQKQIEELKSIVNGSTR